MIDEGWGKEGEGGGSNRGKVAVKVDIYEGYNKDRKRSGRAGDYSGGCRTYLLHPHKRQVISVVLERFGYSSLLPEGEISM